MTACILKKSPQVKNTHFSIEKLWASWASGREISALSERSFFRFCLLFKGLIGDRSRDTEIAKQSKIVLTY
jgi:hypothetical protein